MLRRAALALLLLLAPLGAQAQSYLVYPSQTACQTRSAAMCAAMKCDGTLTVYWWDCSTALNPGSIGATAVAAGSYAMQIAASGAYAATGSNTVSGGTQGLSAAEQSALLTAAQIAPLLPSVAATP